ncbi:MAG: hypothetical protein KatS3mg105_4475 [Gemmatales bacterium]|nr:MAG: hypothetical protein KatS3mg105_4475 [Gemmatales bacterium]
MSIEREIDAVRPALILLGILLVAAYLLYHFLRHPVATGDPKEEMPLVGEIAVKLHESSASLRAAKRDSLDQKEAESERSDNDGSKQLDAAADSKLGDDSSTAIPTPKKSPEQLD